MLRNVVVATAAVLSLAGIGAAVVLAPTAAAKPASKVICTQIPQKAGVLDHEFIAGFMSEHIAEERTRFQTVQGVSTVLCAY